MAFRGIWGISWDNGRRIQAEPVVCSGYVMKGISKVRMEMDYAISFVAHGDTIAVLAALLIGKRELIMPESSVPISLSRHQNIKGVHNTIKSQKKILETSSITYKSLTSRATAAAKPTINILIYFFK